MADEKKTRRGGGPGRGSERNEERTRRAKRRAAQEAAIIGDLSQRINRDCVFRNRDRVRAEVLVHVLRQLHRQPDIDKDLHEACGESLFGKVAPGARRPRAARMVRAMVRKAFKRSGLPDADREFSAFLAATRDLIWVGIASPKKGDLLWQERFGLRLNDRLKNLVEARWRDAERRGTPGKAVSLDTVQYEGLLLTTGPSEERHSQEDLTRAIAALARAIERLPAPMNEIYRLDGVGRIIAVRDAAEQLNRSEDTIKKYRARARDLLQRDSVLRAELTALGITFRTRAE